MIYNEHMNSNEYRRVQAALLQLDDVAKNDLDERTYEMVRQRVIEPVNAVLFQLHIAFEKGREAGKQEKPCVRPSTKTKKETKISLPSPAIPFLKLGK